VVTFKNLLHTGLQNFFTRRKQTGQYRLFEKKHASNFTDQSIQASFPPFIEQLSIFTIINTIYFLQLPQCESSNCQIVSNFLNIPFNVKNDVRSVCLKRSCWSTFWN